MKDYEPESGFNLPPGCCEVPEPDRDRTCMWCRHCFEECCDMGLCMLKLRTKPMCFDSWQDAMDYMEVARVDMQEDGCSRWEVCDGRA